MAVNKVFANPEDGIRNGIPIYTLRLTIPPYSIKRAEQFTTIEREVVLGRG